MFIAPASTCSTVPELLPEIRTEAATLPKNRRLELDFNFVEFFIVFFLVKQKEFLRTGRQNLFGIFYYYQINAANGRLVGFFENRTGMVVRDLGGATSAA